ncbi:MAG: LysR substrate-binding domain-containing protein [Nocardioides sp.]|uniref:LysR substrate-binding domain-containing protein n=1 Tax=Nocardioides sp. TaxID=35761 RepID=UPI0039E4BDB4
MLPGWTPDLGSLDLLLTVAETGSIASAAEVHGISQPSASTRLSRLERRLGVTLFVRSSAGTRLTPVGEAVAAWAAGVVEAARALTDGVSTLRTAADARLRVAASLTIAEYLLPPWLLTLRARHPEVEVAAAVANSHEVAARVVAGEVDLGLIEAPELPDGVTGQHVGTDEVVLVVSTRYPLAARARAGLAAAELVDLPLLVREEGSGTRDTFLHALAVALRRTPSLPHAISLGSTATILATARAGGGVGVLSARAAAADIAAGTLVRIRVLDLAAQRPLTAIWLGRRPTPLAQELIGIAGSRHE